MNNIKTIVMYRELTVARQTDKKTDRVSFRGASLLKKLKQERSARKKKLVEKGQGGSVS